MRQRDLIAVILLIMAPAAATFADCNGEEIWHHRNLGKAFYENPATQYEAVGEFKKALELCPGSARETANYGMALFRAGQADEGIAKLEKAQKQDPSIPHTWFNLGIAYKQKSEYDKALGQFERMVELAPDEPISHYNLGVLYKLERRVEDAIRHFERSAALDSNLAGPHFQLATAYRQAKRPDEAKAAMAKFRELKAINADAAFPEDLEWSYYSEIYETLDPANARDDSLPADLVLAARELASNVDAKTAGLLMIDLGGDGKSDLLAYSARGFLAFKAGKDKAACGLEKTQGTTAVAAGDVDNDGFTDLAVATAGGSAIYRQEPNGSFAKATDLPTGSAARTALFLDYDHDYDLDLFLLGDSAALLRNNGEAGWSDQTADFPFIDGKAIAATAFDVVADTQGTDLAVVYEDKAGVIYRDRLAGNYEPSLLRDLRPGSARAIRAADIDHDGWTDLVASSDGVTVFLNDQRGGFKPQGGPAGARGAFTLADIENRGSSDLVASGTVYRNRSEGIFSEGRKAEALSAATALVAGDFDADGRLDLAGITSEGRVVVLDNRTTTTNRWLTIRLEGVKNLRLAPGSEVEVKAGARYQKKLYRGTSLHFGLGAQAEVDAVRITWPNGLIQNESRQGAGQIYDYKEAQRLSGSCPMIFTWNGSEFEFITDVLGVAPLGASAGDGEYFPVDHDEYIQIAGESLVPHDDGRYEIRVTEELREVAFLDEVRLIAVDHPENTDLFTNDKFKGPPFPEFRLFGVSGRVYPSTVRDHHGRDVREKILRLDRTYPDGYERDYAGVAEVHHLDLDFDEAAADNEAVLILAGWVDWADGSTFLNASQASDVGLIVPYLQVKDEAGHWVTVIDDMGIPAGKPKTIAVDLTGKFLSASREIRIVTNLCVYWDEIFLSEETAAPEVRMSDLHPVEATLSFRGFSKVVIHPERKQPEYFVYAEWRPTSMWNPTRGKYTRYGDVVPLLSEIDDRFVIMGSGDEVRLFFDATTLPALADGWRRDFLLFVDGWAKDGDANTAHSQTVGPLPYHGMPQYPYEEPHAYPADGERNLYREYYNTRPALRLIRPLPDPGAP